MHACCIFLLKSYIQKRIAEIKLEIMDDGNDNNDNDNDEMEVDNEEEEEQQQHQPVLLRRISRHALNRRHNRHGHPGRPKFSLGTKISLTDNILYEQYENSMIIRLDGEIIGYERIIIHTDDDDDKEEMTEKEIAVAAAAVAASYQIDTNDNGNRDESKSTSATATATDSTTMEQDQDQKPEHQQEQQQCTFLKFMSETEIKSNLSNDDPSYIIDLYFGRNLREMIQVHHTLVRDRSLMPDITQMNWCTLFQAIQRKPTLARARFPLYDEDGDVIGNFTILAMALLIILLNKRDDDDDDTPKIVYDVDDKTIIKTLLQFYPKGIEQGKYHDKNRQLKGGSKFLGILHFILENDDEEDQHIIYQNNSTSSDSNNEQPDYFANLLDPEILKLLITSSSPRCTSSYNHGQYLCTEYCPSLQNHLPIHRFMYSAWVTTSSSRTTRRRQKQSKQYNGITKNINTITDWLCSDGVSLEIDDTILLSPQLRIILQNNWQSVTFMLCEKFTGTMNYSTKVLNYLLYDCIAGGCCNDKPTNPDDSNNLASVETIFGFFLHHGGGGIVKWFKDHLSRRSLSNKNNDYNNVPNSLITLMFKYLNGGVEPGQPPQQNYTRQDNIQNFFHSCLQLYVNNQRSLLSIPPTNITCRSSHDRVKAYVSSGQQQQQQYCDHNYNDKRNRRECVLDALAIVQRNMVVFLEAGKNDDGNDEVSKNDDGNDAADENENERRMLQLRSHNYVVKHLKIIGLMWKKYYNTFWLLSITTPTSILTTADTITTKSNTTNTTNNNNNNSTNNNNNNNSTTTISDGGFATSGSATGINLLPRGHHYNINNNDVNVVERIYELLRANPAAILLATTTTTSRTVFLERRRRQQRTALAMATAAATSATSIIAPTVTPSKPALAFGQVSEIEVEGVGK
ncbi:hypothetical protein FRACYDRAFT_244124 [Fragilariopsis cylindrus CCMP1102]|uniref:Uncharacterized protein n=1 Tax=Fragilariopsis cylindrus CCMP1102 TaxID=635003 RepID=A0A1E7F3T9_9STRA|nr:hypothetical protein FRACYDRAFT_244124 [Fragilariopsis cylindrus CCMP1102]|eukprot:OEU12851.1 hypothetical protein FRACYDRAFT_244124 [Fragilariopsis cylindrus CCMP1102]